MEISFKLSKFSSNEVFIMRMMIRIVVRLIDINMNNLNYKNNK